MGAHGEDEWPEAGLAFTAPASVVAPLSYSSLIWASLYGWIIFSEWPDLWTWVGAALIIASGLYIFHRERLQHREEAT